MAVEHRHAVQPAPLDLVGSYLKDTRKGLHATAARLALRSFDWVIPLDSPHVEVIVREGLGWTGEWPATLGGSARDS